MVLGFKNVFRSCNSYSFEECKTKRESQAIPTSSIEEDSTWPEVLAALSCILFMIPAGISLGYSSVLIPQLESTESDLKITTLDSSYIASSLTLATPVGDVMTGFFINKLGRLTTVRLGLAPYMVGWACIALATNVPLLIVGRILTGLYTAMAGGCISAYVPEVVSPSLRGSLILLSMVFFSLGYLIVYVVGAVVHWRTVAWIAVPLCLIPLALLSMFSTESPFWLVLRGRDEDAFKSLAFLHRASKQPDRIKSDLEAEIKLQRERQGSEQINCTGVLHGLLKQYKPILIMLVLLILHEFSGSYIFVFYTVSIFQDLGTNVDPYLCTVGNGVLSVVLGAACSLLMKYVGRRPLLLVSTAGMAASLFVAGFIKMEIDKGTMAANISPVVCVLVYTVFNGCGMLNIPWILPSEFFPGDMRVLVGMIYASSHLLMFAAIESFPFLPALLGGMHLVLWLFAGLSLAAAIFVYLFIPETHNKPVREVQEYFQRNTIYVCRKKLPPSVGDPS